MITSYDKAIVALIMAAIFFINKFFSVNLMVDEQTINSVVAAITPILVYLVPNKPKVNPADSSQSGV